MTLLYADGFDDLQVLNSAPSLLGWGVSSSSPTAWDAVADRYTGDTVGRALQAAGINGGSNLQVGITASSTVFYGVAIGALQASTNGVYRPLAAFVIGGSTRATVWLLQTANTGTAERKIEVRVGTTSAGALLVGTSVGVVDNAAWYYVEVKYVCHASTGSVTIRVNEIEVATATGIDTTGGVGGTTINTITQFVTTTSSGASVPALAVDDFYVANDQGSVNNNYLGDIRVARIRPSAAGDTTDWTPSTGSNWQNVDEVGSLAGTPYNAEGTDEGTDYYNCADLPATATGAVLGVVQKSAAWCTVLNVDLAFLIKDSTTETERAAVALGTTTPSGIAPGSGQYGYVDETKPGGGVWTTAEINAVQIGQRVKSIT